MEIAGLKSPSAHVILSYDIWGDIIVWIRFLEYFNGRAVWQRDFVTDGEFCLQTDSAGSLGFAAIWKTHWCAEPLDPAWKLKGYLNNSVLIELFPNLVAIELWGTCFQNRRILFSTDNKGVMYALNCLSSKSLPVIVLLRHLIFKCLSLNFWIKAKFIPGRTNDLADALSGFQMERFTSLLPNADLVGLTCPKFLWKLI